jgi:ketosteroid isomerase-like protein
LSSIRRSKSFLRSKGRNTARRTLALLLAALLAPASIPAQDAPREVEQLERDLVAAIGRGDLATYDRIVADDYVAFLPDGGENSKAEILASYRSGGRAYTGLEIFDVKARIFGDTAVVGAKTKGSRREGGRDVPNRVRYIRVFAKREGRWRAVAQMSAPLPQEDSARASRSPLTGNWGGDHVGMQVTDRAAILDFDCARGSIEGPIPPDEQGRFDVPGTYVPEGPGPVRPDQLRGKAARYHGKVEGNTMTLSVELSGTDVSIGTFALVRDRLPRIRKCG